MKIGRGETNHLYCDVDGTLLIWPTKPGAPQPGEIPKVNAELVANVKAWHKDSGGVLVIWSMGGPAHAVMARDLCEFGVERVICIGKPDLAIDDNPHVWGKRGPLVSAPEAFKVPRVLP